MRSWILILAMLTAAIAASIGIWCFPVEKAATRERSIRLDAPLRPPQPLAAPRESILATYENTFRCTVYYSPREAGFTQQGGFDVAPETRPGLQNRKYPKDFLRAVQVEGFGRLKEPVDGRWYVRYWGKEWGFIEQPVDQHRQPLVARQSCAISQPHELVQPAALLRIRCPNQPGSFDSLRWRVNDTGSGLEPRHLDLYWGEDDPLGPGKKLSRPKSFDFDLANPTILVVADAAVAK